MLVPLPRLLEDAEKGGYAVIAPDFLSIHMLRLELEVAETLKAPVIMSYPSLPVDRFRRFKAWTRKLLRICENAGVPVCLHLDHGKSVKACLKAIDAGFTSVMIDGSAHPFEENLSMTKTVVAAAREKGVYVEAEIGHVGTGQALVERGPGTSLMTDPEEAGRFVRMTGVDCLAVSVGTMHGNYRGEPEIDFHRLQQIKSQVPVPLVLHGGSGTGEENLREAVKTGIRKINLFTEFLTPYIQETMACYRRNPFRLVFPGGKRDGQKTAIQPVLEKYFRISRSLGRAG